MRPRPPPLWPNLTASLGSRSRAQIASGVSYMHSQHVLHRDLSAANVFLARNDDIKVGDFGLSKAGGNASLTVRGKTLCGTPNYFSPEMVHGEPYGKASDAWCVGLLAHEILTLHHPFAGAPGSGSLARLLQRICACEYDRGLLLNAPYPPELTVVAGSDMLLHVDPEKRLTLEDLLQQPSFSLVP